MINYLLSSRLIGIIAISSAYLFLIQLPGKELDFYLNLTYLLIILISSLYCFLDANKPFNLLKIVMAFHLIFFGLIPILDYKLGIIYYGGNQISDDEFFIANIIIIATMIIYVLLYKYIFSTTKISQKNKNWINFTIGEGKKYSMMFNYLLLLDVIALLVIMIYYKFELSLMLFRSNNSEFAFATEDRSVGLIVNNFLRPLLFNVFATYFLIRKKIDIRVLILLFIAILGASPTALSRFATASLYMSIIFLVIWRKKYQGIHSVNLMLFGFVFIFPLLDFFRYFSGWASLVFTPNLEFYSQGHFDAYQLFVRAINSDIVTYGYQLLGALLFFVPRSIWPEKPIGTGSFLSNKIGLSFDNISMTFWGEGYINFGWIGLLVFILFMAVFTAKLDKTFWIINCKSSNTLFPLVYVQLIGLVFFIMRGDLMSSYAYTCGSIASIYAISTLLKNISTRSD